MNDIGQIIGRFHVQGLISTGRTSTVYKAVDIATQQEVALKVLNPEVLNNIGAVQRFLSQIAVLSTLEHPNIAKVEGFGEQGGRVYVGSELAPDGPIVSSGLTASQRSSYSGSLWYRLDLLRQVADGLYHAHRKNVLHLDLSPKTVLLKRTLPETFVPKIIDFGFNTLLESSNSTSSVLGDPAYLAPEQWQASEVDPRTDIYALGVILYQIATGVLPFAVTAPGTAMYNHLYVAPKRPTEVRADVPHELDGLILRCLAKKPQDRFASAADLSAALRIFIVQNGPATQAAMAAEAAGNGAAAARPVAVTPETPRSFRPAGLAPIQTPVSRQQATAVPRLDLFDERGAVLRSVHLDGGGVTIGTAQDNTFVLDSRDISPHHARVDWQGDRRVTITDLGSTTSTFVDEHRLLPQVPQEWPSGQQARIGRYGLAWEQLGEREKSKIDVIVERSSRVMTLVPGKATECRITLANHRTVVDHVSVSVDGIPGEWVKGRISDIALNPYDKYELVLSIQVPKTSASTAGEYAVTIRANSVANPDQPGEAEVKWTVAPFDSSTLNVTPPKSTGTKRGKYTVTLQNEGNRPDTYSFSALDEEHQLSFMFRIDGENQTTPAITLKPGAKAKLRLGAETAKWHWFGSVSPHPFKVQAVPQLESEAQSQEATFAQSPVIPTWSLAAAPIVLIAVLFLLSVTMKPRIKSLLIDPPTPRPGQAVTVHWVATRSRSIEIRPIQSGIRPAAGEYTIPVGFEQTTVLTIVASNLFGTDQREIVVQVRPPGILLPAQVMLRASSERIKKGDKVVFTWNVTDATKVEFSEMGDVGPQGSYEDQPKQDHTYTLTAYNAANQPTPKSVRVKVEDPTLTLEASNTYVKQGQSVMLTWSAPGAETVRIDSSTPIVLTGNSGVKQAILKAKGKYTFTLISTIGGVESKSTAVVVDVACTTIQTLTKRCGSTPQIAWR
jgi:hypothetical protein